MKLIGLIICGILCVNSYLPAVSKQHKPTRANQTYMRNEFIAYEAEISKMESALVGLINEQRAKYRFKSLSVSTDLSAIAKTHSNNMAKGIVDFGHDGFEERAREIRRHGLHIAFGENVAFFHHVENPLLAAIEGWMNSKHHRENILGDFNETGVGIAYDAQGKCYMTQLFAKLYTK